MEQVQFSQNVNKIKSDPKITVCIPAYNEEKNIAECLQALVNQTTNEKFEVILVNNNSTDQTIAIAEQFKKKLQLKIQK